MPITLQARIIQSNNITRTLNDIGRRVEARSLAANRYVGDEAVKLLRAPSVSQVNVDTGLMRRSFYFRASRDARNIQILNTAHSEGGFFYPNVIERRFGGVARTIQQNRQRIAQRASFNLRERPDPPARLPRELPFR